MPAKNAPITSPAHSSRLRPATGTALHHQIFIVLRDEITRGVYADALPSEESLCQRFSVSRITVRRALADLVNLGFVERRHGLGTFVRMDRAQARNVPSLGVVDALREVAAETKVEVLEVALAKPPTDVANLLQLPAGEQAVHALRIRSIDGAPVMLTDAWVPAAIGRRVTKAALRKRALYEILMAQGIEFGRVIQEITAQAADPPRAQLLQTDIGAPLLKLARLLHDQSQRPVQYLTVYLSAERSRILMDISGGTPNTLSTGHIVHDAVHGLVDRKK